MKKIFMLALFVIMSVSFLAACNEKTDKKAEANLDNLNLDGMPIVKEEIELKMFAPKRFASQNWNDIKIWNEYENMTNIKVKWENVDRDNLAEKRNILLAGGDYPDVLFGNGLTVNDLMKYGKQEDFMALNDLIDQYAPNFKALLEQYPEVEKAITMPDGNIYSFPTITDPEFKAMLEGSFMWLKEEWLKELGLEEPETTEEMYQLLKAIKENYPDAIPMGGGPGIDAYLIPFFKGAWGLGNRGASHPYVDVDPETNELRFIPTAPRYKEMLEYLNKIYEDGLIDKDFFTANADQVIAKGSQGIYGVLPDYNPEAVYSNLTGYIGGKALKGPHGDQLYAHIGSPIGSVGQFVITKDNPNPEATVRWVDYLYSDEGSKMFFMGFEDETYVENEDGTLDYTDEIKNHPDGLTQDQAVGEYLVWPGVGYPGILKQDYFKGSEGKPSSIEASEKVDPFIPEEIWPPFNYTIEELEEMNALRNDIETYINEMNAKFITGARSLDEWDDYVAQFDKMKLEKYMEIYNDAYERYNKQ